MTPAGPRAALAVALGCALAGAALIRVFRPAQLFVRKTAGDRDYGHGYRRGEAPPEQGLAGSFHSPIPVRAINAHSSRCLTRFTIGESVFVPPACDGRPSPFENVLYGFRGLRLEPGKEYAYSAEMHWKWPELEFYDDPPLWRKVLFSAGLNLVFLALLLVCRARSALGLAEAGILQAGFLLRSVYVIRTAPWHRADDYYGHSYYVRHVLAGNLLPGPQDCWECHQPPLAYWLAAAWSRLIAPLFPAPLDFKLQLHALFLSGILLLQLAWLAQKVSAKPRQRLWLLTPCVFWPLLVMKSSAFSNDLLSYNLWLLLLSLLLERAASWRGLALTAIAAAFSKLTFLVPVLAGAVGRVRELAGWRLPLAAVIIAHGFWFAAHSPRFIPAIETANYELLNDGVCGKVDIGYRHVFGFSWPLFWQVPYTHSREDRAGRQYTAVHAIKAAITGWDYHPGLETLLSTSVARALICLNLALVGAFVWLSLRPAKTETLQALAAQAWVSLLILFLYRIGSRCAGAAEGRYVLPGYLSMALFVGSHFMRAPRAALMFKVWVVALCSLSALLILARG